ncbi:OmpA family protein [Luteirhabdus pelagi]|uniref:OmpA family protein n=1 Tax=Luteirhabdus pelagi TaxID=2792783 RepID=UPI00193A2E02|nr:OmpA family protein [Luteirhabdus pelagi]
MMKHLLLISLLAVSFSSFGQHRSRADRFFEKGDFINAAKYYEEELADKQHKKDLENISISYYNTFQYKKARIYLYQLVNGRFAESDKTYDNEFNFKLHHVYAALGDYEKSVAFLKLYKEGMGDTVNTQAAIETIEEFKLKNPDYTIKKARFNSDAADFGAVKLNNRVYFTSDRGDAMFVKKYKWTHQPFLDIYSIVWNEENDSISAVQPISETINSKLHEGNFCFSNDGKTIYISRSNTKDGKKEFDDSGSNNIHLYKSVWNEGAWSEPEKLPFNTSGHSYQHPALSPDGTKLYFSSDMEGGYGSFDIYYVTLTDGDDYSAPVNLGPTINTPNREHFPFVSEKGNLFFSSNGHLGQGMLDIFVSEHVSEEFTTPINLGAPINSPYDDFNLNYHTSEAGFFASNRDNTDDDIFHFKQIGEIFLREYINTFEIRDAVTKSYVPDAAVQLVDKNKASIYENTLDSIANFNVNIIPGRYTLSATAKGYFPNELSVMAIEKQDQKHVLYLEKKPVDPLAEIVAEKNIDENLKEADPERFELLTDTDGPPVVEKDGRLFFELEPIYFDFDMWNIRADSKLVLDALAEKLERYPNVRLKINAHTDTRGTERYNQVLSERRAEATRNYLALEAYINARRLKFEGHGEKHPIVSCPEQQCTEEEHQQNRRSEFEIISY